MMITKIPKPIFSLTVFHCVVIALGFAVMGCQGAVDRLFTLKTYEPGGYCYNYDCISEDDLRKVRIWWLEDMNQKENHVLC